MARFEEPLAHERELAEVTLAAIGEGVIRTDADGRVDYMNPAAEALTGWPLAKASGRRLGEVYQVVTESSRRPRRNPVEICLAEKRTVVPPGLFTLDTFRSRHATTGQPPEDLQPIRVPQCLESGSQRPYPNTSIVRHISKYLCMSFLSTGGYVPWFNPQRLHSVGWLPGASSGGNRFTRQEPLPSDDGCIRGE